MGCLSRFWKGSTSSDHGMDKQRGHEASESGFGFSPLKSRGFSIKNLEKTGVKRHRNTSETSLDTLNISSLCRFTGGLPIKHARICGLEK